MARSRSQIIEMLNVSISAFESRFYTRPAYIELSQEEYDTLTEGRDVGDGLRFDRVPLFVGVDRVNRPGFGLRSDDIVAGEEALPCLEGERRFVQAEVEGKADSKP